MMPLNKQNEFKVNNYMHLLNEYTGDEISHVKNRYNSKDQFNYNLEN